MAAAVVVAATLVDAAAAVETVVVAAIVEVVTGAEVVSTEVVSDDSVAVLVLDEHAVSTASPATAMELIRPNVRRLFTIAVLPLEDPFLVLVRALAKPIRYAISLGPAAE